MPEHWVVNASPLIVLSKIGKAALLTQLADQVVVPQAVAAEILAGPVDDPARQLISQGDFRLQEVAPHAEILTWDLGAGETAVLSYALAVAGWTAVLDDGAARRCARIFKLPCKGTLALVLLARKRQLIPSASSVLRDLLAVGFRLDDAVIREALYRTVGETW